MRNSIGDYHSFDCGFSIPPTHDRRRPLPDNYIDLEESEEEEEEGEEINLELGCPYCSESFDALGLCVHLEDQHPLETKSGVCPLCATNLGRNMISHLIIQHETTLKSLCKRKLSDNESFSIISLLRKKLQEEHLRTVQKESTSAASSTNVAADPLLLSFICNPPQSHETKFVQLNSSPEPCLPKKLPNEETIESDIHGDPLAQEDQEEKAQRSDFVQTILLSTIFADNL